VKGSLHENVVATAGFPDMVDREAERWTEKLEAWAARMDAAGNDLAALGGLLSEIEDECGQGEAWHSVNALWLCVRNSPDCIARESHRTAARDAILNIPMPEPTDD
jgi:hypothetical protein